MPATIELIADIKNFEVDYLNLCQGNSWPGTLSLEGGVSMRAFLAMIIVVWAVDTFAFQGRFTQAAWQEAKYQGHKFNYYLGSKVKSAGL